METGERLQRWEAKPAVSRAIRTATLLVPIALALITGLCTSRIFGTPDSVSEALLRVVTTGVTSAVVMAAADRVARRFVPLAALYHFTLLFPDRAPSRFGVALRSGNSRKLERRIADARDGVVTPTADQSYYETLLELVSALNGHDRLTRGHCERTRAYTELVIKELELPAHDADRLRWAALLHDIGKLGVDAEILNKAGRPTDEEWVQLRAHPEIGERLAAPIAAFLGPWMSAISQHHERWDGGGYPAGLARTDIHLGGRIVAVTDAYDVMTSARSYKKAISPTAAREELVRCAGTQFDPEIVRAFLAASLGRSRLSLASLGSLVHLREAFALLSQTPLVTTVTGSVSSLATSAGAAVATTAMVVGSSMQPAPPSEVRDTGEILALRATHESEEPAGVGASSSGPVAVRGSSASSLLRDRGSVSALDRRTAARAGVATKQSAKDAKAREKAAEDARKDAEKQAEKDAKAREKAAEERAKARKEAREDAEKQAEKDAKAREKAAEERAKAAEEAREDAEKQAEKDAKAREEAAEDRAKAEEKAREDAAKAAED